MVYDHQATLYMTKLPGTASVLSTTRIMIKFKISAQRLSCGSSTFWVLRLTGGGLWKTLPLTPNSGLSQKSTYLKTVTEPSSDKIQVHCVNRSFKRQYLVLGWQMRTWKTRHLTCLAHWSEYQRGWKQHNDLAIIEWLNINYWNK